MFILGWDFFGGAIDIQKYFDQLNRDLVYGLMRAAGMPARVLDTYARFQEGLKVRKTISGALGEKYRAEAGVTQGDPFSMLAAAIIMRL